MSAHGEVDLAGPGSRGRMRRALGDAVTRAGGARNVSGLSLMAVLCASAVAPVVLVGQEIGPVLAAWLATAASVGSNLLADVITSAAGRREGGREQAAAQMETLVAVELEARMAGPGLRAAALRSEVAGLLREGGAQQVLLEALTDADSDLRESLAEGMMLLAGQFQEFAGLLGMVRDGVRQLQVAAQSEIRAQGQHRHEMQVASARILQLLKDGSGVAGGAGVVYNTLPPDTAAFTGRNNEIRQISGRMAAAVTLGGVIAIDGMPGVGKSALAVHVAHQVTARFPDRQLFVDLHAHSAGRVPADPAATLASLLTGDGVDPRRLPTGLEDRSALWRSRMAARRALLVLDNAADSAQVAPLLPGGKGCLVLVTSRRHLGDLPFAVDEVSLDVLPPEEAVAMFLRLAPRSADHHDGVAQLVTLAGCLPLAIALLARVYVKHRAWSMDELIQETRSRLLTLTAENLTVAAAFDLSYQTLAGSRQRFFRLLGLHPGSDLDSYAAAALTGTGYQQAVGHLQALHGDHLLTEPGYRRYGMHDVIRAYARDLAYDGDPAAEREAAIARLLHYYAHTAQHASVPFARYPRTSPDGPAAVPDSALASPGAAGIWLRTEYPNLDAAFTHAHTHGLHGHAIALAAGLAEILQSDGPWTRALEIHQISSDTAERQGHPNAQAAALTNLGRVRYVTGDYPATGEAHTRALGIYRALGNRPGEAIALHDLGRARYTAGDFHGAADFHIQALEIFRSLGHRHGEAHALSDLGSARCLTGDYPGANDALTRALEIFRSLGHTQGEATALGELGGVRELMGDFPGAGDALTRALEIYRSLGLRLGEATALSGLGRVQSLIGDVPGASDALTGALEIYRSLGHDHGEAGALTDLGRIRHMTGDYPAADDAYTRALEIFRTHGNRGDEAWALNHYAANLAVTGQRPRALALYRQALDIHRELDKPDDEALSLEGIADHHVATGDPAQGAACLHQALTIYQRLGMRAHTARVQALLARFGVPLPE